MDRLILKAMAIDRRRLKNADMAATTLAEFGVNSAVEKPIRTELLESVAASEPIARKLHAIQDAPWPLQFSHVIQPAQPFLAAIIAHAWHRSSPDHPHSADSAIWILCPSVHSQELLYESLLNWQPDALFLPEAEFAAGENVLPDPEIAAERLAVLMEVGRGTGPTRHRGNTRESRSSRAEASMRWNLPSPNFSAVWR